MVLYSLNSQDNMQLTSWAICISALVGQAMLATSTALFHMPAMRRHNLNEIMQRSSEHYEGSLERRSPQSTSVNDDLSLSMPDVEQNTSTTDACIKGMQAMTGVSNAPGFAACYNILDWHQNTAGMFQADLRLFKFSNPTGDFTSVPMNDITVQLIYPNSTQFSILGTKKRSLSTLQVRQNGPQEIQQFSLVGNFKMQLDFKKLNTTQLMSLLIPQIILNANVNGSSIQSQIQASDSVYFTTGQFKGEAAQQMALVAARPEMAVAAIEISKGFVLPGTTFGIYPTGLIVTALWCVLFILAFGLGTLGRIRHRDVYRKRLAATSSRGGWK